jgi:hypothetical protein
MIEKKWKNKNNSFLISFRYNLKRLDIRDVFFICLCKILFIYYTNLKNIQASFSFPYHF